MIYLYVCENEHCWRCGIINEVDKKMKDADKPEYCQECYSEMKRVYTAPSIKTNDNFKH